MLKEKISAGISKEQNGISSRKCTMETPPRNAIFLGFVALSLFLISLLMIVYFTAWLVPPAQAAVVNGTFYKIYSPEHPPQENKTFYYNNITPKNNPREFTIYPGDTIYLGGTYDLSYVAGVSKQFAWWKEWKREDTDCSPDIVNTISYIDTNGAINPKMVYIDPAKYKIGNWWQWDGCYKDTSASYKTGDPDKWLPYMNDNNLAFRIIYPPVTPEPTAPPTVPTTIRIPTKTIMPTINASAVMPTPEIKPIKEGWPWWIYLIIIVIIIIGVVLVI